MPGDILSGFDFAPLAVVLHILLVAVVVGCCHGGLLFPVFHIKNKDI